MSDAEKMVTPADEIVLAVQAALDETYREYTDATEYRPHLCAFADAVIGSALVEELRARGIGVDHPAPTEVKSK